MAGTSKQPQLPVSRQLAVAKSAGIAAAAAVELKEAEDYRGQLRAARPKIGAHRKVMEKGMKGLGIPGSCWVAQCYRREVVGLPK